MSLFSNRCLKMDTDKIIPSRFASLKKDITPLIRSALYLLMRWYPSRRPQDFLEENKWPHSNRSNLVGCDAHVSTVACSFRLPYRFITISRAVRFSPIKTKKKEETTDWEARHARAEYIPLYILPASDNNNEKERANNTIRLFRIETFFFVFIVNTFEIQIVIGITMKFKIFLDKTLTYCEYWGYVKDIEHCENMYI